MARVAVVGHRGTFPENTLEGFSAAIEAGADMLELDVMATLDQELVIHHDALITPKLHFRWDDAAMDNAVPISSLTLDQIKEYGYKASRSQIPSLLELFTLLRTMKHPNAAKVRLMIEMKKDPIDSRQVARLLVDLVHKNGIEERILYASFDQEALAEVHKLAAQAELLVLFDSEQASILDIASSLHAKSVGPFHTLLKDRAQVASLQRRGFKIIPWTINDPKRWKELIEMGVDGIITDDPENLFHFLRSHG